MPGEVVWQVMKRLRDAQPSEDQWTAFEALVKQVAPTRVDILTGFIGRGATRALARLGLRARIVVGLPSERAGLTKAQIDEIAALQRDHEVR